MKKLILVGIFLTVLSSFALADTVQINTDGWTQQQKNYIKAAVSSLLHNNKITHDGIVVNLPDVTVNNPSDSISALTGTAIKNKIIAFEVQTEAARVIKKQEQAEKDTEINGSILKDITLAQVDTKIDSISNLSEAKLFLKRLVKYLVAREILP